MDLAMAGYGAINVHARLYFIISADECHRTHWVSRGINPPVNPPVNIGIGLSVIIHEVLKDHRHARPLAKRADPVQPRPRVDFQRIGADADQRRIDALAHWQAALIARK